MQRGEQFGCSSDLPLEVVSEAQQRWASTCVHEKARGADQVCESDGVHSLTAKQIHHSSNDREMSHTSTQKATLQDQTTVVVTGSVFSNLYEEKNTTVVHRRVSVILHVLLFWHFCLHNCVVVNVSVNLYWRNFSVWPRLKWICPQKAASHPTSESQTASTVYSMWLCNYVFSMKNLTLSLSTLHCGSGWQHIITAFIWLNSQSIHVEKNMDGCQRHDVYRPTLFGPKASVCCINWHTGAALRLHLVQCKQT